jgi:cellulose synthase/poly-beta-1,6-N-acetylglucosamine synthase-like glycosyltransferase
MHNPSKVEIIAVDDGSTDRSWQIACNVANTYTAIKLFRRPHAGQAATLNFALEQSRGDFIAIIEADVEPAPDWLQQTMSCFKTPGVVGVGGYLVTPTDDNWIARLAGYEIELKQKSNNTFVKHITAANAIYRREALADFRFDTQLENASLDAVLNQTLIATGKKLVFCKTARALHHYKGALFSYLARQYAYAYYRLYVDVIGLYPYDRFLAFNIAVCDLALLSLPLLFIWPWIVWGVWVGAFLFQVPHTLVLLLWKRDWAILMSPFVIILRNWWATVGFIHGWLVKMASSFKNKKLAKDSSK